MNLLLAAIPAVLLAQALDRPASPPLPDQWHGQWRGTLTIADASSIPMGLDIEPIEGRDAMAWRIIYGEGDSRQVRHYELLPGDAPGRFVIDEKNGILLDARLEGDVLVSVFEAQGTTLVARYELRGEDLRYEILTWETARPRATIASDAHASVTVKSFPVSGYQRGILKRAK